MNLESFLESLHRLDADGIEAAAGELETAAASAAGEVSWWRATMEIERLLKAQRASRDGARAAMRAATAVQGAAARSGIELPDMRVTSVARAAAEVARGLVVSARAADDLLAGCQHLVAA